MDSHLVIDRCVWLLSLGIGVITAGFFYRILCSITVKREGRFFTVLSFVSSFFLCNMTIFANDMFNVTLDIIWFVLMMLLCFRGKVIAKLSTVAVLFPLIIAQNFLVAEIFGTLWVRSGGGFWTGILFDILEEMVRVCIWYILYRVFMKRISMASRLFDSRTWALLGTVCMASLVSIITFIYYAPEDTYKIWPGAAVCMVTNIGCLTLAGYFTESIKQKMEQKNLKLLQDYYEELEKNQTEIRKFRHDMNNHLSVIRELFETGDKEEAEEYFKEVESQIDARNRVFCKNNIVNAVLNAKYNLAVSESIDCFFHIELPEVFAIDPVSLCTIFANTLDNAIEASLKITDREKRRISVKARAADNGYFSYEIENAKINDVREEKEKIISDKTDKKSHGLGLINVREIVEKYEGMMDVSYTEEIFRVVVLIRV